MPIINTIAGGGPRNVGATSAALNQPSGGVFDGAGNYYVAVESQVLRIDPQGQLTVIAGNGSRSYGGDGGAATLAGLNLPNAIALDGIGSMYIADTGNARLRKVSLSSGVITTVAGNGYGCGNTGPGVATNLCLWGPTGVAVESTGNVLITVEAGLLWRLTVSTGMMETVAGTSTQDFSGDGGPAKLAQLEDPLSVRLDTAGNIYIADECRIRKITSNTGIINTIVGNGTCGYSGDGGPALAATLNSPWDTVIDALGNLYIADSRNEVVRRVAAGTNIITTVAGNGSFGFSGDGGNAKSAQLWKPFGVALDANGNLYIADYLNNRVRRVVSSTGIIQTFAGNGFMYSSADGGLATDQLFNPSGLAFDSSGNLYVSQDSDNIVRRIDAITGVVTTVAGTGVSGASGDGGLAKNAQLNSPQALALDGAGNLYIATFSGSVRRVILSTGIITTVAGNGSGSTCVDGGSATTQHCFTFPSGLATDGNGNLYISDQGTERVFRMNLLAGTLAIVAGTGSVGSDGDGGPAKSATLSGPQGIALDGAGNIFIADTFNNRIRRVDAATGIITTVAGTGTPSFYGDGGPANAAMFYHPRGIALDGSGNLYFAERDGSNYTDGIGNRVRRISLSNGIIETIAGCGPVAGSYEGSTCVASAGFDGDGAPSVAAIVSDPHGVTFFNGQLYVADYLGHRIRSITNPGAAPLTVSVTHSGNFMDRQIGAVFTITVSNQTSVTTSGVVTVTDLLPYPTALNIRAPSGPGWTCQTAYPFNSCSRQDSLAPGLSFPPITFLADVGFNASSPQLDFALVTGGGLPAGRGTDSVTIVPIPAALSITKGHTGNFAQGQQGATYYLNVSNSYYAGPTNSAVTVTETTPPELTLVSMAGTGWTCVGGSCTRSDVLGISQSYPPIAVTVNVAPDAPYHVTNQASVSGGGSPSATASDVAVVNASNTTVSFSSTPSGASITIDGTNHLTPFTVTLSNTSHSVSAASPFPGPTGTQYTFTGWNDSLPSASRSITVGAGQPSSYSATYETQYQLTIATSPVAGGSVTPAGSGFYDSGATVPITASANGGYSFSSWSGTVASASSASTTVTMDAAKSVTANFAAVTAITVQTSPTGLQFSVDGGAVQTAPQSIALTQGTHTIAVVTTQVAAAGTQYIFTGWSDSGAASHSISVGASAATYTATYKTQYQLTTAASPVAGGSVAPASGGFYDSGATVPITASANSGYSFTSWSGAVSSASSASTTVTMTAPRAVTANFSALTGITFQTNPPGLAVTVDGNAQAAPFTLQLSPGTHTVAIAGSVSPSAGTQYLFSSWSDGLTPAHSITVVAGTAATYGATYLTKFQLTTSVSPANAGTISPDSGNYFDAGSSVPISVTSTTSGFVFANWSGAGIASPNSTSTTVVMNSPLSVNGNFNVVQTCTYSLNPASVNSPQAEAGGSFTVNTQSGCPWNAISSDTSWLSVSAGTASGTGSGVVNYTAASNGGAQRIGSIDVHGQTFAVSQAGVTTSPGAAISPTSGSGSSQSFTFTFTDPAGYADIAGAGILFNNTLAGPNACYVLFARPDIISLVDDTGNASAGHVTSTSLGAPAVLQNSQCVVLASQSSQTGTGTTVQFILTVVFKAGFAGAKNVWANVNNNAGQTQGFQQLGTFAATAQAQVLAATAVNPASGTGQAQAFTFSYSDPNGAPDISGGRVVFNSSFTLAGGCYLLFDAQNNISLATDDGNGLVGTAKLGKRTAIENSQCVLYPGNSYQTQIGQTLNLTVFVAFKAAFAGSKNIYSDVQNNAGTRSAFPQLGTYTVSSSAPLGVNSVSPATATGPSQLLRFVYSDPNGFNDITSTQVIISSSASANNSCAVTLNRAAGSIALAGSTTANLGQASTLTNSQCIVNAAASSQFGSGNHLTLSMFVTMKNAGAVNVYSSVTSGSTTVGPVQLGTWNVSFPASMTPVSVSPLTGSGAAGTAQSFTFTLANPAGASDISGALIVLYPSLQGVGACYLLWGHGSNLISLASDDAHSFISAVAGATGLLSNSQCTVDPAQSFAVETGNTVNLTVSVAFKSAYQQFAQLYSWVNVQNAAHELSGWSLLGRFSVE